MGKTTLADRLRSHMDRHQLSQAEVARQLGTSQANVHRWLNGMRPRLDHYFLVLDLIGERM